MKRWSSSRAQRGFSLLEMVIIVTVVALLLGLAIPAVTATLQRGRTNSAFRKLMDDIAFTRAEAASARTMASGERVLTAALRFTGNQGYDVVAIGQTTSEVVKSVNMGDNGVHLEFAQVSTGGGLMTFAAQVDSITTDADDDVSDEINFRSNGSLSNGAISELSLRDPDTGRQFRLQISLTGVVRRM
jgi:Tfp pilus assembly protein FimT